MRSCAAEHASQFVFPAVPVYKHEWLESGAVEDLAKATLAYHLADEDERPLLVEMFQLLAGSVEGRVPQEERQTYGRSLFGVHKSVRVSEWTNQNLASLIENSDEDSLLTLLWPLLWELIEQKNVKRCTAPNSMKDVASDWLRGRSYAELCDLLSEARARIDTGKQKRVYTPELLKIR